MHGCLRTWAKQFPLVQVWVLSNYLCILKKKPTSTVWFQSGSLGTPFTPLIWERTAESCWFANLFLTSARVTRSNSQTVCASKFQPGRGARLRCGMLRGRRILGSATVGCDPQVDLDLWDREAKKNKQTQESRVRFDLKENLHGLITSNSL